MTIYFLGEAGNNAVDFIEQVLMLDSTNADARAAFARIAPRYAILARSRIRKGHLEHAKLYVNRGLEVDRSNAELRALDAELPRQVATQYVADSESSAPTTKQQQDEVHGETPAELFNRIKRFLEVDPNGWTADWRC